MTDGATVISTVTQSACRARLYRLWTFTESVGRCAANAGTGSRATHGRTVTSTVSHTVIRASEMISPPQALWIIVANAHR